MHADICDPEDTERVQRFRQILKDEGAEIIDRSWGFGVDVVFYRIGDEILTVFADTWSLDIEGSEKIVNRISQKMQQSVPE